ncbi:MAG: hypothetical protein JWP46_3884 [Modestobacter sp.]|nr:hypothetical protein [Modestobacter sp.]
MHGTTTDRPATTPRTPGRTARQLLTALAIIVVVGVLPVLWHASPVWQVTGVLVAAAYLLRTARILWRKLFSTDPRVLDSL